MHDLFPRRALFYRGLSTSVSLKWFFLIYCWNQVTFQLIGLAFKHISAKIQRANSLIFVSMSQLSHCKRMKLKTHYELFCLRGSTLSCGIQKWIRPNKTNISKPLLSVKYKVFKTKVSHLVTNKPIRVREILISMNSSWKLRRLLLTSRVIWEPLGLRYIKRVYYCDVTHSAVIGNQLRGFFVHLNWAIVVQHSSQVGSFFEKACTVTLLCYITVRACQKKKV